MRTLYTRGFLLIALWALFYYDVTVDTKAIVIALIALGECVLLIPRALGYKT